ncbi:peptidylprolyl isomerase [Lutimonas saemankumensis]|uniref:peptidylprolyl isomerase n=1 Tax=Lutimonas saemankumensis TaxID=483016 RepID=UPI001CD3DA41|nr:peptidylprolyl isomerase [Lutimonas saemankumensis]MCA0932038.1 peptidylprolyl isomerase [Lutimonas saemankumensis]
MKIATFRFFLFLVIVFASCKTDKKESLQNNSTPVENNGSEGSDIEIEDLQSDKSEKKIKENAQSRAESRPLDSINKDNAVLFLQKYGEENRESIVLVKTRLGNMKIRLYEETPLHRASFIFLSKMGYFDTTCFYRVVPDFIIQGGESERLDTQRYKARYERYKIPPEFNKKLKHKYGAIALARDWKDNPRKYSTAFEFYIVQNRKGAHHLDGEHTVFGEVISGFETIDRIVQLEAGGDEWPLNDVFMKVEVVD